MAHEFKPGDLALIIGGRAENIGKTVQVERRCGETGDVVDGEHFVGYKNCLCWVVSGELLASRLSDPNELLKLAGGVIPQSNLMPLKGDEQPAQVHQAERVQ